MRTRQERVATDTRRSPGCRTTPLQHWSKRKPAVEPRWAKQQTKPTGILKSDCKQPLRIGIIRALNECTGRLFRAITRHNHKSSKYIDTYRRCILIFGCVCVAALYSNTVKSYNASRMTYPPPGIWI